MERANRRAITLLELLLALVLVLALAAISLPAMFEASEHRRLRETAEAIETQLLLARAHAMTEGVSVEVRVHGDEHAVTAVERRSPSDARDGKPRKPSRRIPSADDRADDESTDEGAKDIDRAWARTPLYEGVKVSHTPPAPTAGDTGRLDPMAITSFGSRRLLGDENDEDDDSPVTAAVFLPDGSAAVTQELWLSDAAGRVMRIDVGRWTGLPSIDEAPQLPNDRDASDEEGESDLEGEEQDDRSLGDQLPPGADLTGESGSSGASAGDDPTGNERGSSQP